MKKLFLIAACMIAGAFALRGEVPESVNASSFGFNKEDATDCLQKAIDSGAKKVIVENMGTPWIVRPLKLRGKLHLLFKAGAVVEAKKGEYYDIHSCLFSARNCSRIIMEGEPGAIIRMRKKDYQNPKLKYKRSQWRNCIEFLGCYNVTVKNLTVASSGGDGIYIGRTYGEGGRVACRNVLIENCVLDDHHRQGISVISVIGMTVRNCVISNTRGTEPEAGIDFEPNYPDEKFFNILVENCKFINNHWSGINCSIFSSDPADITIRNCEFSSKYLLPQLSFCLLEPFAKSGGGKVLVENCKVENILGPCVTFMNFSSVTNYEVELKNVEFAEKKSASKNTVAPSPVEFTASSPKTTRMGGVHFNNVKITGYKDVPLFNLKSMLGNKTVEKVTGNIVYNGKNIDVAKYVAEDSALQRKPFSEKKFLFRSAAKKPAPADTMSAAIRWEADVAILAEKGKKVSFSAEQRYFDGAPNTPVRGKKMIFKLVAPSGKVTALPDWIIPQSGASSTKNYEFIPEESGVYRLLIPAIHRKGGGRMLTIFHASPEMIWGIRGSALRENCISFRNQPKLGCPETVEGVFEVPAGVKEFWIDTNIMDISVTDPAGKVYTVPRAKSQQQRLSLKRVNAAASEVWKIKAANFTALELLFSENLPGIISPDESRLPRVK